MPIRDYLGCFKMGFASVSSLPPPTPQLGRYFSLFMPSHFSNFFYFLFLLNMKNYSPVPTSSNTLFTKNGPASVPAHILRIFRGSEFGGEILINDSFCHIYPVPFFYHWWVGAGKGRMNGMNRGEKLVGQFLDFFAPVVHERNDWVPIIVWAWIGLYGVD